MKTIQILNFIKPLSLKCLWCSPLVFLLILMSGCNRQPKACVTATPNTIELGHQTTISDCSEFSFNNELKTGEGGNFSNITNKSWTYYRPGRYNISLKAFSKKGNKDETSYQYIVVLPPDSNLIRGKWRLNIIEQREQLFVDNSVGLFDNPVVDSDTLNEIYNITLDSIFVTHNIDNFLLFLNEYPMSYDYENASMNVDNRLFEIVVFEETSMVLKSSYFKGYSLLYLTRV